MREQQVVHLPEGALRGGRLRGLGGELRARVDVDSGRCRHTYRMFAVGEQLPHDRLGLAAVGALEVAELDHRDRGGGGAADVVAGGVDLGDEVLDQRRSPISARARRTGGSRAMPRKTAQVRRPRRPRPKRPQLRLVELGARGRPGWR